MISNSVDPAPANVFTEIPSTNSSIAPEFEKTKEIEYLAAMNEKSNHPVILKLQNMLLHINFHYKYKYLNHLLGLLLPILPVYQLYC